MRSSVRRLIVALVGSVAGQPGGPWAMATGRAILAAPLTFGPTPESSVGAR